MKPDPKPRTLEEVQLQQARRRRRKLTRNYVRDGILMLLGIFSAGFGLQGFIIPNKFIDGGVMGISLLTNGQTGLPLPLLIIAFNLPFLALAYRQISPAFSIKSVLAITLLAIVVAAVPYPVITRDPILVSVFGGFFVGAGIGLMIRGGGVIDGTEVLAIFLSRKYTPSVGDFILLFNILIFSSAAYLLGWETALYAILTYLAASKTVDFILEGIEEFTGVTIISSRSRQISETIKNQLGWGLTVYRGRKGFGKSGSSDQEVDIIYVVITRLEINRLTTEVEKIDPKAFMVFQSIRDTRGGMVKKRALKE